MPPADSLQPSREITRPRGITRLILLCLTIFLVVFPLTLEKPGFPVQLKADEPGYYMMAMSLWHDGDLRCETEDLERLFHEFPLRTENLHVMSSDGWQTTYFAAPILYGLVAAPAAGVFGANGMVALNAALLIAAIWMGASYLRRFNPEPLAAFFSVAFFVLSSGFAYVFWLEPEVLNMFCVTAAFLLAFDTAGTASESRRGLASWLRGPWGVALSAGLLVVPLYAKPPFAVLAIPLLIALGKDRGARAVAVWCASAVLAMALACGLSWHLTEEPWPYLTGTRDSVNVSSPILFAERKLEGRQTSLSRGRAPTTRSGRWTRSALPRGFRGWDRLSRDLTYFLVGRHVGLLLYMPFAVLSIGLWAAFGRKSLRRWALVLALGAAAVAFILYVPSSWQGGGGFIGNRYFVNIYPAFLFLVTTISPAWIVAVGFAAAGLFLGQIVLAPFGVSVRAPTLQAHARNFPYRLFPVELTLLYLIPGYQGSFQSGAYFRGRGDVFQPEGDELWYHGATTVEAFLTSSEILEDATFRVRSLAPDNRVSLCLAGACEAVSFSEAEPANASKEISLKPGKPSWSPDSETHIYRMLVRSRTGEQPRWRNTSPSDFYVGAAVTYLGSTAERQRDLFHALWEQVEAPTEVVAGSRFELPVTVRNTSAEAWPQIGATRVSLSYHWQTPEGQRVIWDGRRTALSRAVEPTETVELPLVVEAPATTGDYRLVLDLVREKIAWFSVRDAASASEWEVRVVSSDG